MVGLCQAGEGGFPVTDRPYAQVVFGYAIPSRVRLSPEARETLFNAGGTLSEGGFHASGARPYAVGVQVCEAWAEWGPPYKQVLASDFALDLLHERLKDLRPVIEAILGTNAIAGVEPAFHVTCGLK